MEAPGLNAKIVQIGEDPLHTRLPMRRLSVRPDDDRDVAVGA
jgi:hypothetical protein